MTSLFRASRVGDPSKPCHYRRNMDVYVRLLPKTTALTVCNYWDMGPASMVFVFIAHGSMHSVFSAKQIIGLQCAPDISRSLFSKELMKDTHGAPVRAGYGCLWRVRNKTKVLPSKLLYLMQHRVVLYRDLLRVYSTWSWSSHHLVQRWPERVYLFRYSLSAIIQDGHRRRRSTTGEWEFDIIMRVFRLLPICMTGNHSWK